MRRFSFSCFFTIILLISACSQVTSPAADLTPVTVQLASNHQAYYAGLYAAAQNGYYQREGLSVTLVEGTSDLDVAAVVTSGDAQFGLMGASAVISARADGEPVRALATLLRRDPVVFFSLKESGITHLQDFVGKRVFVTPRLRSRLHAMLRYAGIDPQSVTEVTGGDATALYTGDVDVASGVITSTALSAQQAGYDLNLIYPDDYGVHFYSITLFAADDTINTNPDLVLRFVRATLDGYTDAVGDVQAVGEWVKAYKPNANADFETASMIAMLPYINTGEDHIGWMNPEAWESMAETMRAQGELTVPLDVADVYTLRFIEAIYPTEPQAGALTAVPSGGSS